MKRNLSLEVSNEVQEKCLLKVLGRPSESFFSSAIRVMALLIKVFKALKSIVAAAWFLIQVKPEEKRSEIGNCWLVP